MLGVYLPGNERQAILFSKPEKAPKLLFVIRNGSRTFTLNLAVQDKSVDEGPKVNSCIWGILGILERPLVIRKRISQRSDSNRRPAVYETAALPLSYAGQLYFYRISSGRKEICS